MFAVQVQGAVRRGGRPRGPRGHQAGRGGEAGGCRGPGPDPQSLDRRQHQHPGN